jgi:hypothetical protein
MRQSDSLRLGREGEKLPNFVGGRPVMTLRRTRSGLGVWLPTTEYNPGDWELVSTPPDLFDSRLELRGPTLRQGFRIRSHKTILAISKGYETLSRSWNFQDKASSRKGCHEVGRQLITIGTVQYQNIGRLAWILLLPIRNRRPLRS